MKIEIAKVTSFVFNLSFIELKMLETLLQSRHASTQGLQNIKLSVFTPEVENFAAQLQLTINRAIQESSK